MIAATAAQPFRWPLRVYYEDTDAAGVVYYANYLRFIERARTEWLGALGFSLTQLEREHQAVFVVHRLAIDYRMPARLGDHLEATVIVEEKGRARLALKQQVLKDAHVLVDADVMLACVNPRTWLPTRIPATVAASLEA